jgi:hypothetical protein
VIGRCGAVLAPRALAHADALVGSASTSAARSSSASYAAAAALAGSTKQVERLEDELLRGSVVYEHDLVDEYDHAGERFADWLGVRYRGRARVRVRGGATLAVRFLGSSSSPWLALLDR